MITEKQKEAVKELCQYVDNFCKENNLSAFMSVAASEDHPDGLEQDSRLDHRPARVSMLSAPFRGAVRGRQPCLYAAFHDTACQAYTRETDINPYSVR